MFRRLAPAALIVLVLCLAFAGCRAVEKYGPTPTLLPSLRDYDRYSAAEIAEHYQRCLIRIDRDHPDLANTTAAQLAEYHGFDLTVLSDLDRACMVRYDKSFRRPTPTPAEEQ